MMNVTTQRKLLLQQAWITCLEVIGLALCLNCTVALAKTNQTTKVASSEQQLYELLTCNGSAEIYFKTVMAGDKDLNTAFGLKKSPQTNSLFTMYTTSKLVSINGFQSQRIARSSEEAWYLVLDSVDVKKVADRAGLAPIPKEVQELLAQEPPQNNRKVFRGFDPEETLPTPKDYPAKITRQRVVKEIDSFPSKTLMGCVYRTR